MRTFVKLEFYGDNRGRFRSKGKSTYSSRARSGPIGTTWSRVTQRTAGGSGMTFDTSGSFAHVVEFFIYYIGLTALHERKVLKYSRG